jgi:hypothetical protein
MDLGVWVGCVAVVAAIVGATAWTERTSFLHLSLFRPYRGETWPRGVQEEYDVRWNAGTRIGTRARPGMARSRDSVDDPALAEAADAVNVARVTRVAIRRPAKDDR